MLEKFILKKNLEEYGKALGLVNLKVTHLLLEVVIDADTLGCQL
jgi:hypothetical protein